MSSVTSTVAQKPRSSSFLVGVTNGYTGGGIAYSSAFTLPASVTIPKSVLTRSELEAISGGQTVEIQTQNLYRDLGREIVVYLDDVVGSPHRNVYRECQRMNVEKTEGADGDYEDASIFVKVFSARGAAVAVARMG